MHLCCQPCPRSPHKRYTTVGRLVSGLPRKTPCCLQAEKVRETQMAAAALRGSEKAAHVRAVTAAARAKEELEGSRRRAEWEQKLQRAGDARYEMTQTMLSSLALVPCPTKSRHPKRETGCT